MPGVQGDACLRKLAGDRVEFFGILNDDFCHDVLMVKSVIKNSLAGLEKNL